MDNFPGFLKVAYRDKFIEDENWARTNADGFDFFDDITIDSDPEFVTKALKGIKKQRSDMLKKTGATEKSNAKSTATREKANEFFKKKKWIAALKKYSKSIAQATNRSTELGFAYANRSALLLHRGFYKECLEDIEQALKLDYPADKKPQLITRKEKATELVSSQKKKIIQEVVPTLSRKNNTLRGASEAIKVSEDKKFGRYIEATRDIAAGEVILVEDPYALVISQDYKTTHCGDCGNLCFNPIPCKKCSVEMYCSEKCRDKAFDVYHQYECIVLNHYPSEIFNIEDVPEEERNNSNINKEQIRQLALRITLKGFKGYRAHGGDDTEDLYDQISTLQTHRNNLSKSALMILAFNLAKQFQILKNHTNFLSKLQFKDKEDILKYHLLRNRLICCFNIASMQYKLDEPVNDQSNFSTGIGLYVSYSMFNHSCVENVGYGFYGTTMVMRAIRNIEKGKQCFVNYGHFFHEHHKLQRLFSISRNYLFTCKCVACEKDWPTFDRSALTRSLCLNSRAYIVIEATRAIVESQKILEEDARQEAYKQCALIDHLMRNDGPTVNLILLYNLLHLISVLRYQGMDF